jgi:outer membrane protein assembly factor BamB
VRTRLTVDERYYKRVEGVRTTTYGVLPESCEPPRSVNRPIIAALFAALCAVPASLAAQTPPPASDAPASSRIVALDPRWTVAFESALAAPAGFDQDMAYVPLKSGELVALALDNGAETWRMPLAIAASPATGDGLVFAAVDSSISALDQRTGKTVWRVDTGAPLHGTVHWESGWVLASTVAGDLLSIRAENGSVLWRSALGSPVAASPTLSGDYLYVALADGRIVAVEAESGATVWTHPLNEPVTGMLALREQLLIGTRANLLHSLALDRGRERWRQKAGGDVIGAPIVDEDRIYFAAFDNVLRALSRRTGNLVWTRKLPSRPSGGAQRVDDVVLVPFTTELIGAYQARTGAEAFTIRPVGTLAGAPFLRDHSRPTAPRLVAMSREGALQGFAPRFEAPPVPLSTLPGTPAAP